MASLEALPPADRALTAFECLCTIKKAPDVSAILLDDEPRFAYRADDRMTTHFFGCIGYVTEDEHPRAHESPSAPDVLAFVWLVVVQVWRKDGTLLHHVYPWTVPARALPPHGDNHDACTGPIVTRVLWTTSLKHLTQRSSQLILRASSPLGAGRRQLLIVDSRYGDWLQPWMLSTCQVVLEPFSPQSFALSQWCLLQLLAADAEILPSLDRMAVKEENRLAGYDKPCYVAYRRVEDYRFPVVGVCPQRPTAPYLPVQSWMNPFTRPVPFPLSMYLLVPDRVRPVVEEHRAKKPKLEIK